MISVDLSNVESIESSNHLYQWDKGQQLEIKGLSLSNAPEVHFGVNGSMLAIVVNSTLSGGIVYADIPNEILMSGKDLRVYVHIDGTTIKNILIPVFKRNMPENYVVDSSNVKWVEEFETEVNEITTAKLTEIDRKGTQTLDSIPNDYTALQGDVTELKNEVTNARLNTSGITYATLKARLDGMDAETAAKINTSAVESTLADSTNPVQSKVVKEAVDDLKSDLTWLESEFADGASRLSEDIWQVATISNTTGKTEWRVTNRIAAGHFELNKGDRMYVDNSDVYIFTVFKYQADETYIGIVFDNVTEAEIAEDGYKYRVVLRHKDNTDIAVSESSQFRYFNSNNIKRIINQPEISKVGTAPNWQVATISNTTGKTEWGVTNRIAAGHFELNKGDKISISDPTKYIFTVFKYQADETYIGIVFDNIVEAEIAEDGYKYRVVLRHKDNTDIAVSESSQFMYYNQPFSISKMRKGLAGLGFSFFDTPSEIWQNIGINSSDGSEYASNKSVITSGLLNFKSGTVVYTSEPDKYLITLFNYGTDGNYVCMPFDNVTEARITDAGKYRVVIKRKDGTDAVPSDSAYFGYATDGVIVESTIISIPTDDWQVATINGESGNTEAHPYRITSKFVVLNRGVRVSISDPTNYMFTVFKYDLDGTYIGISLDKVVEGEIAEDGYKYRIVMRNRGNNVTITVNESSQFVYYNPQSNDFEKGLTGLGFKFFETPVGIWKNTGIHADNGSEYPQKKSVITSGLLDFKKNMIVYTSEPDKYLITLFNYGTDGNYVGMPFDNVTEARVTAAGKYRVVIKRKDGTDAVPSDSAYFGYIADNFRTSTNESSNAPAEITMSVTTDETFEKLKQLTLGEAKFNLNVVLPNVWPDGLSINLNTEGVLRHPMAMVSGIAVLISTGLYDEGIIGVAEENAKATVHDFVMSAANAHKSNGGIWGNKWQSALWAFYMGEAYFLTNDQFTDAEKEKIRNVVLNEADYAAAVTTLYWKDRDGVEQFKGDSKYEDLQWWMAIIQLAITVYPDALSVGKYKKKIAEFGCISSAMPKDLNSSETINGFKLSDLEGYNVQADGTVINHGFIHPTYMVASVFSGYAAIAINNYVGNTTIQASVHNMEQIGKALYNADFSGRHIYEIGNREPYFPVSSDWGTDKVFDMPCFDLYMHKWGMDPFCDWSRWANLHLDKLVQMQSRQTSGTLYVSQEEDLYGTLGDSARGDSNDIYNRDTAILNVFANTLLCLIAPTIRFDTTDYING